MKVQMEEERGRSVVATCSQEWVSNRLEETGRGGVVCTVWLLDASANAVGN